MRWSAVSADYPRTVTPTRPRCLPQPLTRRNTELTESLRLLASSADRIQQLPAKSRFWRAQVGCDIRYREGTDADVASLFSQKVPFNQERMKPRPHSAHEGRVNPKGIPCLYLATDENTAMAEVRPWLDASISVGRFLTVCDLKLIDCSKYHDRSLDFGMFFGNATPEALTYGVWTQVDRAFSRPVTEDPSTAEYIPTQIIAEAFHRQGYDGLVYKSRLGAGHTVVLFDLDSAELVATYLFRTTEFWIDSTSNASACSRSARSFSSPACPCASHHFLN
jgi:hypothetical protein